MLPLVTITLFLPLVGALILVGWPRLSARAAHITGITAAGLTLLGAAGLWFRGPVNAVTSGRASFAQVEEFNWIPSLGAAYRVGVDGMSLALALLTAVLFVAALIFSIKVTDRPRAYIALFLLLETSCLGVFLALDMVLFYVFWEVTLVAMYFIIAGWGHQERQRAALTFFIYTLLGSLPLLLAILALYLGSQPRTFDMRAIIDAPPLTGLAALLTFLLLLVAFAVKIPLFPLHTWLPLAHTEAPTAGSVVLAGVLLKLGTYGLIRFGLQMTPQSFKDAAPYVIVLAVFSALYGAFAALAQTDLKRMVAYTSVNHMGYVVVGVAAAATTTDHLARTLALDGAVLQMISHGLVTGALFLLVGMLQDRAKTRQMAEFGGLLRRTPLLGWFFILAAFASLGLPGLAHFPAEFQIFLGTFQSWPWAAAISAFGIIITAGLYLRAIQVTFLGELSPRWQTMGDLGRRELWAIIPLLALIILIGILPSGLLDFIHRTMERLGS